MFKGAKQKFGAEERENLGINYRKKNEEGKIFGE